MKKLIAMVMTAAMVASLVPATAFARGDEAATAKIVDAKDFTKNEATTAKGEIYTGGVDGIGPELRLTMTSVENQVTSAGALPDFTIEMTLDNAEWTQEVKDILDANNFTNTGLQKLISIYDNSESTVLAAASAKTTGSVAPGTTADAWAEVTAGINASTIAANAATWMADGSTGVGKFVSATNTTDYTSWADIRNAVTDAKTSAQVIEEWVAAGWTKVTSPDGTVVALEKGNTSKAVNWSATPGEATGDFAPVNAVSLEDAIGNVIGTTGTDFSTVKLTKGTPTTVITNGTLTSGAWYAEVVDYDDDYAKIKITYDPAYVTPLSKDDYVAINLASTFTKLSVGTQATVSVEGVADADDLVYASIESRGISASIKKLANVAEEEKNTLEKDLVIKSTVGDFAPGQVIELKLSKGFEFVKKDLVDGTGYVWQNVDGAYAEIKLAADFEGDEVTIKNTECTIEATSAKAGATAVMTVKAVKTAGNDATFSDSTTVEVMKVVEYTVILSVDEDKEVPVIYSGVNVDNYGITDDSDHLSLEVTAEETFPGAWSFRKGFNFELPEGVYVTDVNVIEHEGFLVTKTTADKDATPVEDDEMMEAFFNAYQEGDHVNFEFEKRVFDDVDAKLNDKEAKVTFELELVADPGFVGDVTLKLTGDLVDTQEVVIAKFVAPYTVVAEQNDLKIDYRYTDIPTEIKITEAEAGLWAKKEATFEFYLDKEDYIEFEDDPVFTIDGDSNLKIKDAEVSDDNRITFTVDTESDEAATVTISKMSLFMQRSIPAGPYDLKIATTLADEYEQQVLFAPDCVGKYSDTASCKCTYEDDFTCENEEECFVADVCDYSNVAKAAFVNIVTAGREQDDASFTTVVEIKIGDDIMKAGGKEISLKELKTQPAYINAKGYTMLPIRAVAVALGINTENVQWNQDTQTVIILYGQRVITMQVGSNTVYAAGTPIPATSSVEIKEGRAYLGLRDLATALGVSKIDWDGNNKIAYLNTTVAEAKAAQ